MTYLGSQPKALICVEQTHIFEVLYIPLIGNGLRLVKSTTPPTSGRPAPHLLKK